MEEETRECVRDCPAGPANPVDGEAADETKEGRKDAAELEVVAGTAEGGGASKDETYCSIEQELWTPCSADCLQERYLDKGCEKEAEVSST